MYDERQTPPVDSSQDMRAEMCAKIEDIMGPGRVEVHHHEVASFDVQRSKQHI
jgi:glutamine synthetase